MYDKIYMKILRRGIRKKYMLIVKFTPGLFIVQFPIYFIKSLTDGLPSKMPF